jgi:MFS family permease
VPLGNLLATAVLLFLAAVLSEEQFLAWGWRVGFWLSVVIVAVGYYIRTQISDSPIFKAHQEERAQAQGRQPFGPLEVFRRYPRGVLTAMGLRFGENIVYYMVVTFSITYLNHQKVDTTRILGCCSWGICSTRR